MLRNLFPCLARLDFGQDSCKIVSEWLLLVANQARHGQLEQRMPKITARLFGDFELKDAVGEELTLGTRKARALLAFLIVEGGQWHSRERLAGLLWGDRAQIQARNSLSQALYEIRKLEAASGEPIVEREPERVRIVEGAIESDVDKFAALLRNNALDAANLGTCDLLDGVDLRDQAFVDWLSAKRANYQGALSDALRSLASSTKEGETSGASLQAARHLVALDPLDEAARRQYMQLLAQSGNRAEAIRQYEIGASLLKDELEIEPEAATQDLLEQIRHSQTAPAPISQIGQDKRQKLIDTPMTADRPVIAVMPFANLDDDPEFAFMVDGLVEDLIFALSAFRSFRVLARTATFRVRDTNMNHSDIQRMFGAAYAVNGRVRRSGAKLRISVELLDCANGEQLWSNRYDKSLDDLFDVEADISWRIAAAIEPTLEDVEMRRTLARPPESLEAYELLQRGYWHLYRGTPQDLVEASLYIKAAVAKDPTYAEAIAGLAYLKYRDAHTNFMDNYRDRLEDCRDTAANALELDPRSPRALRYFAGANSFLGNHDIALESINRAIELCPSYATAYSGLAFVHDFAGNFSDAKPAVDETIRLRPHDPVLHRCIMSKSIAEYQTAQYESAERVARDSLRTNDSWWLSNMMLTACLGRMGRLEEARVTIDKLRECYPGLTLEIMQQKMPFVDPTHRDHLAEGLIQAGWRD
jgi:DNA-binding SARP family transcriptional activator